MSINIQLTQFEGPMALLLYLIRKEEMDIMDINIHQITQQYLDFIRIMKELDLEVAGEFIAMASTLIHIKSKMLLPQYDENGEIVENEDPRKELVQKLLEYQKYQEVAKELYDRPLVGRDVFLRGFRETLYKEEEEITLEDNALYSLISCYRKLLRSIKTKVHQVAARTQSISSRIMEFKHKLIVGVRITMRELLDNLEDSSRQTLITFLSLLELGKMGFVTIYQSEPFSDIWIDPKKNIESDVLSRVEEYDNLHAEDKANEIMQKSQIISEEEALDWDKAESHTENTHSNNESNIEFNPESYSNLSSSADIGNIDNIDDLIESVTDDEIAAAEAELNLNVSAESGDLNV